MADKQERMYEMMLSNLGILSYDQLDKLQNVIRSMLQDLDMESNDQYIKRRDPNAVTIWWK